MGFGKLDGLVIDYKNSEIFITSKNLFYSHFKEKNINSIRNLFEEQLEAIFTALASDANAKIYFFEIDTSNSNHQIYRCIGGFTQDIDPFPPDYFFILVSRNDYVYVIMKKIDMQLDQLKESGEIYNSINADSAVSENDNVGEIAWSKYQKRFHVLFKTNEQFDSLQNELNLIISNAKN
ncbi:MAG: hypothetical protein SFU91_13415 [Chloroherpetonaceae bacterium]|nr:hypothetical protein [Chloroherpetonaceae bacterium]